MTGLPFASVLGPIEDVMETSLTAIHDTLDIPWAWAIIVLTLCVRIVLVPLTLKQTKSMQKLQRVAPQMKELQAKHKGDRQRLQQETMKLYQEHGVSPVGGCLPLVLQLPVFFALFFVLRNFSDDPPGGQAAIDGGEFAFLGSFIQDITVSVADAGYAGWILIVAYVMSQLGSTLLMPSTMDKTMRYLFMAMPFFAVLFVINFPVGLMLYWITSNLWTVGQTFTIRKLFPPVMPEPPVKGAGARKQRPAEQPQAAITPADKKKLETPARPRKKAPGGPQAARRRRARRPQ